MAFKNFFTSSSRLESLIEKIQQQKSNILITGIKKNSKFCCALIKSYSDELKRKGSFN